MSEYVPSYLLAVYEEMIVTEGEPSLLEIIVLRVVIERHLVHTWFSYLQSERKISVEPVAEAQLAVQYN